MKVFHPPEDSSMYSTAPSFNSLRKEAEFCDNGNIKIAVHRVHTAEYIDDYLVSTPDLELLYTGTTYVWIPLFFNGRLI